MVIKVMIQLLITKELNNRQDFPRNHILQQHTNLQY